MRKLIASFILLVPLFYLGEGHRLWGWQRPLFLQSNEAGAAILELLLCAAIMAIHQRIFIGGISKLLHGAPSFDSMAAISSGAAFGYNVYSLLEMTSTLQAQYIDLMIAHMNNLCFEAPALVMIFASVGKCFEARARVRASQEWNELAERFPNNSQVAQAAAAAKEAFASADGTWFDAGTAKNGGSANGFSNAPDFHVFAKASFSRMAGRAMTAFILLAVMISIASAAAWMAAGESVDFALSRGITILIACCPCAFGLAAPLAGMVAGGVGARNGVLYKHESALSAAGKVEIAVLDKAGGITEGRPAVVDVVPNETVGVSTLLSAAGMLYERSKDPAAKAVMNHLAVNHESHPSARHVEAISEKGFKARLDGSVYYGGKQSYIFEALMDTDGEEDFVDFVQTWKPERYETAGKTGLFFAKDDKLLGALFVADSVSGDAVEAISNLKILGLSVVMLTDDGARTATAVGEEARVDTIISGVLPRGKEKVVRRLQKNAGSTLIIGRNRKERRAMRAADVGFAFGSVPAANAAERGMPGGSSANEAAIAAADVVLTNGYLSDVSKAIVLSRGVQRNIKENIFWSLLYHLAAIPLAAGALHPLFGISPGPMLGAITCGVVSIFLALNAMRLNFIQLDDAWHYQRRKKQVNIREAVAGTDE